MNSSSRSSPTPSRLYSRTADALENPTEILELFEEMLDFVGCAPELSAKVSSKLADYFEGLA